MEGNPHASRSADLPESSGTAGILLVKHSQGFICLELQAGDGLTCG